jgi:cytochrome c biogenesis protein CcdA
MLEGPFALAFGAGMVATINPCGFAMLPAYLSYFLGSEDRDRSGSAPSDPALGRAAVVGLCVTAGFVAVFAVTGTIISNLSSALLDYVPYVTVVIGIALVALAVAMLFGFEPMLRLPKLEKGAGSRELGSMFVFGVSYAIASLGCAIPAFLVVTSTTFRNESFLSGVATFVMYGLGMGVVVISLTVYTALARNGLVRWLRRAMPHVNRVAAALLLLSGGYVTYYGVYEIRANRSDAVVDDPVVSYFTDLQGRASTWVQDVGAVRLGLMLGLGTVVVIAAVLALRRGDGDRDHGARRDTVHSPADRS